MARALDLETRIAVLETAVLPITLTQENLEINSNARYRTRTCKTLFLRQVCIPIPSIGLAEKLGLEPR